MSKNNKVKFGLKNCHYALATLDVDTGTVTFGTPVAIPGAVSLSLDPEGDNDPFYADDMVYYMTAANNGYSGDLEVALLPDSFRTDIMHETEDDNGVLVEDSTVEPELHRGTDHRGFQRGQDRVSGNHGIASSERLCKGKDRKQYCG